MNCTDQAGPLNGEARETAHSYITLLCSCLVHETHSLLLPIQVHYRQPRQPQLLLSSSCEFRRLAILFVYTRPEKWSVPYFSPPHSQFPNQNRENPSFNRGNPCNCSAPATEFQRLEGAGAGSQVSLIQSSWSVRSNHSMTLPAVVPRQPKVAAALRYLGW